MLDGLRAAAAWDPIGLANEEPTSVTDRLRAELKELRAGVRQVVEDNHGMPMERPNDAKGLLGCLNEFLSDQKDEAYERTREISSLRHTISMLQAERRKSVQQPETPAAAADSLVASDPPAADPPPMTEFARLAAMGATLAAAPPAAAAASPPPASEEPEPPAAGGSMSDGARSPQPRSPARIERETAARVAAAAESAASAARSEERARLDEKLAASRKDLEARHAIALQAEKDAARLKLGALSRTLGRESEAERAATSECLSRALAELESRVRSQAESHAQALQQTKQRAAQMLAKKDAALLAARQARAAAESVAEGGQQSAPAQQHQHQPSTASGKAARTARTAGTAGASRSGVPRQVSVGVGTSDDEGSRFLAVGSGSDDVASRFARRVAELEIALDQSREANRALEGGRLEDEKRKRVLRARVARHEKAWTSGTDMEYLRNVLLQWFTMPPSGQKWESNSQCDARVGEVAGPVSLVLAVPLLGP